MKMRARNWKGVESHRVEVMVRADGSWKDSSPNTPITEISENPTKAPTRLPKKEARERMAERNEAGTSDDGVPPVSIHHPQTQQSKG